MATGGSTARWAAIARAVRDYRRESFWLDTLGEDLDPRPSLEADGSCDVAIVGAGYTGLWTAYALKRIDPSLDVVICESDIAGAGASGRNGGWCMGEMSGIRSLLHDPVYGDDARRLQRTLFATVDEIGRTCAEEGIDCDFQKGGALKMARLPAHRPRLEADLASLRAAGFGEDCYRFLEPDECAQRIRGQDYDGALYSTHVAALNPARLVRGLARAVEKRGVRLYERSPVRRVARDRIETDRATLLANRVVLATEGYTPELAGHHRKLIPIHSMMIATEPLSDEMWATMGLHERETFGDGRRVTAYGQRTADGRIAFGGRGLYYYGSRARSAFGEDEAIFQMVHRGLLSIFPQLSSVKITHFWGGPLGVARDWTTRVGVDGKTGIAFGGGYVGEGVNASHLVGATLADLICGRQTERTEIRWLQKSFPLWEPEPLRWLGVSMVRSAAEWIDRDEARGRRANPVANRIFTTFAK